MKKLLCALMAATMLLSLAGCDKSDKDNSSADSSSASAVDSDSKDESSDDESSKETEDESSDDDSSDLDSTSEIQSGLQGNVYETEDYKVEINDKWTLNESAGGVLDCTFNYIDIEDENEAATCFGIQTIDYAITPEDMVDQMVSTYESYGYKVLSTESVKFNGNDAQEIMMEMESLGIKLIMRQTLISDGEKIFAINSTAVESIYDEMIDEIDEVLASFKFV